MKPDDPYVIMPWLNESLPDQKARFPEAILEEYSLEKIESGEQKSPALERKHVFDLGVGVRMIASREDHAGLSLIHFSFGVPPWSGVQNLGLLYGIARDMVAYFVEQPLTFEMEHASKKCVHMWFKAPATPSTSLTA